MFAAVKRLAQSVLPSGDVSSSSGALTAANLTLEATLKAQAQHLQHAATALDTAAAQLLKAGKPSSANRAKQAALTARKHAEEWV